MLKTQKRKAGLQFVLVQQLLEASQRTSCQSHTCPFSLMLSLSGKLTAPGLFFILSMLARKGTARRMPVSTMFWGHCSATVGTSRWLSLGHCVLAASLLCPQAIEKLVALLNTLDRWIDETPPMDQPSRFGNKAFRTWYAKLDQVRLPQTGWGLGWRELSGISESLGVC